MQYEKCLFLFFAFWQKYRADFLSPYAISFAIIASYERQSKALEKSGNKVPNKFPLWLLDLHLSIMAMRNS